MIKTKIGEVPQEVDRTFPKLMQYIGDRGTVTNGHIVLMTERKGMSHSKGPLLAGTALTEYGYCTLGEYSTGWIESSFKDYEGTVTLENDK